MLKGKKIILGVTGSIAAYKAAILVRLLVKEGAEVKVIMTPLAKEFITPLTMATLSKNPILVDFFNPEDGRWNSHVDIGIWADAYLIAPATANTLAKMAHGIADNLLLTTYLSARCPVLAAPAMDVDMYNHVATQENISILRSRGVHIIEPTSGELASGLEGKGRMQEPELIVEALGNSLQNNHSAPDSKKKVRPLNILITAGPTYEPIDPVRFIGNYSSGKMGFAIAKAFAGHDHKVILVTGPTTLDIIHPNIRIIRVQTALQMHDACLEHFPSCDCAVLSAAVADYAPATMAEHKIKRDKENLHLELKANPDIAAALGQIKSKNQVTVGFALETVNERENAKHKLVRKKLDFIVLNSLNETGAGFNTDTNKVTFIDNHNKVTEFPLKSKEEVAHDILEKVYTYF